METKRSYEEPRNVKRETNEEEAQSGGNTEKEATEPIEFRLSDNPEIQITKQSQR